jgi:hypothetical protein
MKAREKTLAQLVEQPSILGTVVNSSIELDELIRANSFSKEVASRLEKQGSAAAISRANFIRYQDADNFRVNRESWGLPQFKEGLVEIGDFQNGFLWKFRAHSTSWSENQYADEWFLTSLEARTVTRYEFWQCDNEPDELDFALTGDYKSILKQLLAEHVYEVLISPAFSSDELTEYIANFSEKDEEYELEEVIDEYISRNPNYIV